MLLADYHWFSAIPRESCAALPVLRVRQLGLQDYEPVWRTMRGLAAQPRPGQADELWLLSHPPVFTQGQAGKAEHLLNPGDIPVVQADRGGQVTYHGPGQLVAYLLLDVRQRRLGVRKLVQLMQQAIIHTLATCGIVAMIRPGAPGVYVDDAKIAALGLRISNGRSYHGLSLNVAMDLQPFSLINPCGFDNLAVTQMADLMPQEHRNSLFELAGKRLTNHLLNQLGYANHYD